MRFGPAHLGQMPCPARPFAIYGSRSPEVTLEVPELGLSGGPKSPAVVCGRHTEVAVNGYRFLRRLAISLVITGGLLQLTGCQGLAGSSISGGTVAVGSGSLNFGSVPIGTSKA